MQRNQGELRQYTEQRAFVMAYKDFLLSKEIDIYEKMVFLFIKLHCDRDTGQAFPSLNTLCEEIGLSKTKIQRCINSLKEKEKIKVEKRFNKKKKIWSNNIYTIIDTHDIWEPPKESKKQITETDMIKYLESKGYSIEKKKPVSAPTKVTETDQKINHSSKRNDIKEKEKSQEQEQISLIFLREKYNFAETVQKYPEYEKELEAVLDIVHTAMNATKAVRISGRYAKAKDVKKKLEQLTPELIIYAIKKFHEQTGKIKNPSAYLLTMLYHAPEQYHLDKVNQESKPEEQKKSTNKFCNFEQHKYSEDEMKLIERAMLHNPINKQT